MTAQAIDTATYLGQTWSVRAEPLRTWLRARHDIGTALGDAASSSANWHG
jgi:hypothetical protein